MPTAVNVIEYGVGGCTQEPQEGRGMLIEDLFDRPECFDKHCRWLMHVAGTSILKCTGSLAVIAHEFDLVCFHVSVGDVVFVAFAKGIQGSTPATTYDVPRCTMLPKG